MKTEGSCHCGKVTFTAEGDFSNAIDCNCSICRRRGSLLAFVPRENLTISGEEELETYTFNHHVIKHRFCKTCGILPFGMGTGPDGKEMAAINVRCLPEVDLDSLTLTRWDGASQ